jgi:TolA-binding protein
MILSRNQRKLLAITLMGLSFTACGSLSRRDEVDPEPNLADKASIQAQAQVVAQKDAQIQTLQAQLNELQTQLRAQTLAEPSTTNRQNLDTPKLNAHSNVANVGSSGPLHSPSIAKSDPQRGFVNDTHIQSFRQGKILFDSEKYPESVLAFSAFIERQSQHPLAGSAQFYLAESYYFQNDFESAKVEYQKLIQYYDRSPHIASAYARQAQCLAELGDVTTANQMRQKVLAFFPRSEAAQLVMNEFKPAIKNETITQPSLPTAPSLPVPPTAEANSNPQALDDVPVTAPESGGNL